MGSFDFRLRQTRFFLWLSTMRVHSRRKNSSSLPESQNFSI
mgnify:CR=1 FL=1